MDNRTKMLKKSLELFSGRGYDAVGIQEIVDSVQVTKPTLYHYFGSKDGLLKAMLEEYFGRMSRDISAAAEYSGDLTQTLNRIVKSYFDFAESEPEFCRFQLSLWFSPSQSKTKEHVQQWLNRQYETVEEVFVLAVKEHGNMKGRHKQYAATFIGIINTYIGLYLNKHIKLSDELVHQVVHQFMHGILS